MQNGIRVDRQKIMMIIAENRKKHYQEYNEAVHDFREMAIEKMRDNLKVAEGGGGIDLYIDLDRPQSHLQEYDDVLGLLEMGTEDAVVLTSADYKKYVMDEWVWTESFKKTRVFYATKQGE